MHGTVRQIKLVVSLREEAPCSAGSLLLHNESDRHVKVEKGLSQLEDTLLRQCTPFPLRNLEQ